jgi:hypothetical protein
MQFKINSFGFRVFFPFFPFFFFFFTFFFFFLQVSEHEEKKHKKKKAQPTIAVDEVKDEEPKAEDEDAGAVAKKEKKAKRKSHTRDELAALPGKKHILSIEFISAECKTIPQLTKYAVHVKHQSEVKGGFFRKAITYKHETSVRLHSQSTYLIAVHHITATNSIYTLNSVRIGTEFAVPLNREQVTQMREQHPFSATLRRYGKKPRSATTTTTPDSPDDNADDDKPAGTCTAGGGEVVDRAKENQVLFFKWKPPAELLTTDDGERHLLKVDFFFVAYKSRIEQCKDFADHGERARIEKLASSTRKEMDGDDQQAMNDMLLAPPAEESRAKGSRRSFQHQIEDELDSWADQIALRSELQAKMHFMSDMRVIKGRRAALYRLCIRRSDNVAGAESGVRVRCIQIGRWTSQVTNDNNEWCSSRR